VEKTCRRCGETKRVQKFKVDRRQPDGRTVTCLECYTTKQLDKFERTPEQIESQREKLKGRKYSLEHRLAISRGNRRNVEKGTHNLLRHGKGHKDLYRQRIEYKIWKEKLLKKCGGRCELCGKTQRLHAHHIKSFYDFPELKYEESNGKILCISCHMRHHAQQGDLR
jgi:hypothetical protein